MYQHSLQLFVVDIRASLCFGQKFIFYRLAFNLSRSIQSFRELLTHQLKILGCIPDGNASLLCNCILFFCWNFSGIFNGHHLQRRRQGETPETNSAAESGNFFVENVLSPKAILFQIFREKVKIFSKKLIFLFSIKISKIFSNKLFSLNFWSKRATFCCKVF